MELQVFTDLDTFLAHQRAWDDLWERSGVVLPTARAELVAHWVRHFAQGGDFRCLAVADHNRLVAGLPLVQRWIKGLVPAGDLPANPWAVHGELLLDASADLPKALQCLCQGIHQTPWQMLWIDLALVQSLWWQELMAQAQKVGMSGLVHLRYPVGLVYLDENFSTYWASRSSNLHRKVRKCCQRLEEAGPVQLRVIQQASAEQWEEELDTAWRIEDASWKGTAGSSVLRTSGMREFYFNQAQILAQWGYAQLVFLQVATRPIAFAFGWESKGVVQVCKIGYDPDFSGCSPGHLLWWLWFQRLAETRKTVLVDFSGPLTDATRLWANGSYPVGRVVLSPHWFGKWMIAGYQAYRTCRGRQNPPDWLEACTAPGPIPKIPEFESAPV